MNNNVLTLTSGPACKELWELSLPSLQQQKGKTEQTEKSINFLGPIRELDFEGQSSSVKSDEVGKPGESAPLAQGLLEPKSHRNH